MSSTLAAECAFAINKDGVDDLASWPSGSFSGGTYGDNVQWGPDYDLGASSGEDLPGSGADPVTMIYTMPGGKTLTFSHVKTRSKSTLIQNGTLVPFLKLNTSDGSVTGTITSVDFKWMKLDGGAWVDATANEVDLLVNENGGYAAFYTAKTGGDSAGVGITIPKTAASGTIAWSSTGVQASGAPMPVLATLTPNSFCASAVSYDDKLGLRIFAGGFAPNAGVTPCY
jgi:hypothetical protein